MYCICFHKIFTCCSVSVVDVFGHAAGFSGISVMCIFLQISCFHAAWAAEVHECVFILCRPSADLRPALSVTAVLDPVPGPQEVWRPFLRLCSALNVPCVLRPGQI